MSLYRPDGIVNVVHVALLLSFAIVTEVVGTVALRYSHGFTKFAPSAIVVLGYGASFWLLALVLKELSIGTNGVSRKESLV